MRISDWSQTCALPIWRLEQAGKERRLVKRDARCRLAEVVARRCIDTISAGAEVDPVEVDGEDLVLGEAVLPPERQHDLLALALQIGRESCRERVCQYVKLSVVAVS